MSNKPVERTNTFTLHEDWAAVIGGFLIILISLTVGKIPLFSGNWKELNELGSDVLSLKNIGNLLVQFGYFFIIGLIVYRIAGKPIKQFISTFPFIFIITIVAVIFSGNAWLKGLGLEAVIFSLVLGLIIGNLFKLPSWFTSGLSGELFVKIGLVLLGTTIIFGDLLKAGTLGLIQALIVVLSVWYFAFWVCKKLKLDEDLSLMISSAVSICGVSAAIATAGAIKGDSKKLSYVISLVLITAIPMMLFMPYIAKYFGWSEEVTGAWIGGTIDTTGAVVASGTLVGETALKISTIVKFSQNVLLGLAAIAISVYWAYSKKTVKEASESGWRVIWERFPKFVLGFTAASLIFSLLLTPEIVSSVKDNLKGIQTFWFVIAFTSIGLETRFSDIINMENKKPLYAFLIAQFFNILLTLAVAFVLFGN